MINIELKPYFYGTVPAGSYLRVGEHFYKNGPELLDLYTDDGNKISINAAVEGGRLVHFPPEVYDKDPELRSKIHTVGYHDYITLKDIPSGLVNLRKVLRYYNFTCLLDGKLDLAEELGILDVINKMVESKKFSVRDIDAIFTGRFHDLLMWDLDYIMSLDETSAEVGIVSEELAAFLGMDVGLRYVKYPKHNEGGDDEYIVFSEGLEFDIPLTEVAKSLLVHDYADNIYLSAGIHELDVEFPSGNGEEFTSVRLVK